MEHLGIQTRDNDIATLKLVNDAKKMTRTSASNGVKLFLVGAATQDANGAQTNTIAGCYIGTDGYLYSNSKKIDATSWGTSLGAASNALTLKNSAGAVLSTITAANLVTVLGTTPVKRATADADGNNIANTYIPFGAALLSNNSFATKNNLYISKINNRLYAADQRFVVTHEHFDANNTKKGNLNTSIFDGAYEHPQMATITEGDYAVLYVGSVAEASLTPTTTAMWTYGQGSLFLSFYSSWEPDGVTAQVYTKAHSSGQTAGWHSCTVSKYYGNVYKIVPSATTYVVAFKITYGLIDHSPYCSAACQLEYYGSRSSISEESALTKYPITQTLYGTLNTQLLRPRTNNTYDLGDSSYKWANVYATTFHGALSGSASQLGGHESSWYQQAITSTNKLAASLVSGLATVATSGSYNDLSSKPTALKNPYALTFGSKTYDGSAAVSITESDVYGIFSSSRKNVLDSGATEVLIRQITTNKNNITGLTTRVGTAETDITSLEGRMDTAEDDIDTAEWNITSLQTELTRVGALADKFESWFGFDAAKNMIYIKNGGGSAGSPNDRGFFAYGSVSAGGTGTSGGGGGGESDLPHIFLTEAEYAALAIKDPGTIYCTYEED